MVTPPILLVSKQASNERVCSNSLVLFPRLLTSPSSRKLTVRKIDVDQRLMEAAFELEARERKLKRITQEKQALSAALARAEKRVEQLTTRRLDSAMDTPLGSGKSFPRSPIDPPPPPQFTLG